MLTIFPLQLIEELLRKLPAWEAEQDRPFLVNGIRILDVLLDAVEGKENSKKPRAGSVPPRAKTPSSTISTKPASSGSDTLCQSVPNKRPRLASSSSRTNADMNSQEPLTHRVPFSSRSGVANVTSPTEYVPPGSVFKHGRTPSSSLPRPKSVTKANPSTIPQAHKSGYGGTIGLGHPSGSMWSHPTEAPRSVSHSVIESKPTMPSARSARTSRRESFKPRTSVDNMTFMMHKEVGGIRFGNYGPCVKEEDEE